MIEYTFFCFKVWNFQPDGVPFDSQGGNKTTFFHNHLLNNWYVTWQLFAEI